MMDMFKTAAGYPLLMGAIRTGDGVNFTCAAGGGERRGLILYKKGTRKIIQTIEFKKSQEFGNVRSVLVKGLGPEDADYNFTADGGIIIDPYAQVINGHEEFGAVPGELTCSITSHQDYDWRDDEKPSIDFSDNVIYRLHVRGFTAGKGSGARHRGTFRGIVEKIPHLKELGVNMVELMPAYDFYEVAPACGDEDKFVQVINDRLNFWGYTRANYFSPKVSFSSAAAGEGAVTEFKDMVRALHREGIEVSMEFYFPGETSTTFIIDCLRNWVISYHIDCVHINPGDGVMDAIKRDAILSETKILSYGPGNNDGLFLSDGSKRYGIFNDDFMIDMRKFLKGDENMASAMAYRIRRNPENGAVINYAANHQTFTVLDSVSYERRHNEANGEGNADGSEFNFSWNCGTEGPTRKKKITDLRKKQVKNALAFVILSQGTPMIFSGDEMANSNSGNNNPYCQDNDLSHVNWGRGALKKEIFEFTKLLLCFRREHAVLHQKNEVRLMDYRSVGFPDASYHGHEAWVSDFDYVSRQFAVMYCGAYAGEESDVYIAYNMYWEEQRFALPNPGGAKKWRLAFSTDMSSEQIKQLHENGWKDDADDPRGKYCRVAARTIAVFVAR